MKWFKSIDDRVAEKLDEILSERKGALDFITVASGEGATVTSSSAVVAVLSWIGRNCGEAELVSEEKSGTEWVDAPLPLQLQQNFTNMTLQQKQVATTLDLALYGNSLWVKLKNNRGTLAEFQYVPWQNVTPIYDEKRLITAWHILEVGDVPRRDSVHFKLGSSPEQPQLGLSIASLINDHGDSDTVGATYITGILKNPAMSQILSIKPDSNGKIPKLTPDAIARMEARINGKMSKGGMSKPLLDVQLDAVPNGFTPKDLNVTDLIEFQESRICALFGIPPQVVGLSSGKNPTYSNFETAQKIARLNCLVPIWDVIATSLSEQAPELWRTEARLRYKTENVAALAPDANADAERISKLYSSGVIDRWTANQQLGLPVNESDRGVYSTNHVSTETNNG